MKIQIVKKAIVNAKKELIHDHIDHCLDASVSGGGKGPRKSLEEFKEITKYL